MGNLIGEACESHCLSQKVVAYLDGTVMAIRCFCSYILACPTHRDVEHNNRSRRSHAAKKRRSDLSSCFERATVPKRLLRTSEVILHRFVSDRASGCSEIFKRSATSWWTRGRAPLLREGCPSPRKLDLPRREDKAGGGGSFNTPTKSKITVTSPIGEDYAVFHLTTPCRDSCWSGGWQGPSAV